MFSLSLATYASDYVPTAGLGAVIVATPYREPVQLSKRRLQSSDPIPTFAVQLGAFSGNNGTLRVGRRVADEPVVRRLTRSAVPCP